jgi:hypothetical protein
MYAVALMMCGISTLRFMILMEAFGPKYQIIKEMIKKLILFLSLIAIIVIPYAVVYHSVYEGTEETFSMSALAKCFYTMMWTLFLEIKEIVADINAYPTRNSTDPVYTVTSSFLYVSFPLYVLACNILLLNLIIAVFAGLVDEYSADAEKIFRLMRYSNTIEFEHKTVLPPPFNLIEYLIRFVLTVLTLFQKLANSEKYEENTNFAIKQMNPELGQDLSKFEDLKKNEYVKEFELNNNSNKNEILIQKKLKFIQFKLDNIEKNIQTIMLKDKNIREEEENNKLDQIKNKIDYLANLLIKK